MILIKSLYILFCFFLFSFLAAIFFKIQEIVKGDLRYYEEIGWVDWQHAKTDGTTDFINSFREATHKNNCRNVTIQYSQNMKMKYFVVSSMKEFYVGTIAEEAHEMAYIFESVTEAFEKMQGKFPLVITPCIYASSFEEGDITGNNISFYCAYNHVKVEEFKNSLIERGIRYNLIAYMKYILGRTTKTNNTASKYVADYKRFYTNLSNKQQKASATCISYKNNIKCNFIPISIEF